MLPGCKIFGTATLNEKGQLVIPQEARRILGVGPGSKLMVMSAPHGKALLLIKIEDVEARVKDLTAALENAKNGDQQND